MRYENLAKMGQAILLRAEARARSGSAVLEYVILMMRTKGKLWVVLEEPIRSETPEACW